MENIHQAYPNEVLINLFLIHGESSRIVQRTCRRFNELYPDLPPMNAKKFRRIEGNFLRYGNFKGRRELIFPVRGDEDNQINVLAYFEVNPQASIRSCVADLGLSFSSIQRILQNHRMHDYKLSMSQHLHFGDAERRVQFCENILIRIQEDNGYLRKIIWTDESKFSREGIFNRHNTHFWANNNPHLQRPRNFQEKFSFNVFCLMKDNQIRYSIYDESLTSNKYVDILRNTVSEFLDELPLAEMRNAWFQMDGAPAHNTYEVSNLLDTMFEDRWYGLRGPFSWPARSPDLSPLDFYLWGRIKTKVYASPVNSKDELRNRVTRAFAELDGEEIRRSTTNAVQKRILKCLEVEGRNFENLLD